MAKTKKDEIAEAPTNALAPVIDYGDDFGAGLDDVGQDEAGIPFLKILQAQSPEVIGPDGKIDGATAGMILNTGTADLTDEVTIVPAIRQHVYVEWRPRGKGGGIVALHQPGTELVEAAIAANAAAIANGDASRKKAGKKMAFGEFYTPEGNELVETFYVYCVVLDAEDRPSGFVVVPFASTAIKHYKKKFINRVRYCMVDDGSGRKRNPPMFAHRVKIGTAQESNDDGTWFNYQLTFAVDNNVQQSLMTPDNPAYLAGRELKAMVDGGDAKADLSKASSTEGGEETADGGSAF